MFCRQVFGNILADFAVFRVFGGISRDFAEMPEFRGSATARNIRSPDPGGEGWARYSYWLHATETGISSRSMMDLLAQTDLLCNLTTGTE